MTTINNGPLTDACVTAKTWPGKAEFIREYLLTVLSTGQYCESENIINKSWKLIHGE